MGGTDVSRKQKVRARVYLSRQQERNGTCSNPLIKKASKRDSTVFSGADLAWHLPPGRPEPSRLTVPDNTQLSNRSFLPGSRKEGPFSTYPEAIVPLIPEPDKNGVGR